MDKRKNKRNQKKPKETTRNQKKPKETKRAPIREV